MQDKLESEITKLIAEIIEVPIEELRPEADFTNDLEVDSMRALEIVAAIEKRYRIVIPEQEIPKLRNLNQILELVKELKKT